MEKWPENVIMITCVSQDSRPERPFTPGIGFAEEARCSQCDRAVWISTRTIPFIKETIEKRDGVDSWSIVCDFCKAVIELTQTLLGNPVEELANPYHAKSVRNN